MAQVSSDGKPHADGFFIRYRTLLNRAALSSANSVPWQTLGNGDGKEPMKNGADELTLADMPAGAIVQLKAERKDLPSGRETDILTVELPSEGKLSAVSFCDCIIVYADITKQ